MLKCLRSVQRRAENCENHPRRHRRPRRCSQLIHGTLNALIRPARHGDHEHRHREQRSRRKRSDEQTDGLCPRPRMLAEVVPAGSPGLCACVRGGWVVPRSHRRVKVVSAGRVGLEYYTAVHASICMPPALWALIAGT